MERQKKPAEKQGQKVFQSGDSLNWTNRFFGTKNSRENVGNNTIETVLIREASCNQAFDRKGIQNEYACKGKFVKDNQPITIQWNRISPSGQGKNLENAGNSIIRADSDQGKRIVKESL